MSNEGALTAMHADAQKEKDHDYRNKRYSETKVEKQFTAVKTPFPLAHVLAKMLLSEKPSHPPSCVSDFNLNSVMSIPLTLATGECVIGDELNEFVKLNNTVLVKKANNLSSKMHGPMALTAKLVDATPLTLDCFGLGDAGKKLLARPFVVASRNYMFAWDIKGWPVAGLPVIVLSLKDRLFVNAIDIDVLVGEKLKSIVSLPTMAFLKGPEPKAILKLPRTEVEISKGTGAYFPPGTIPLVTSVPVDGVCEECGIDGDKAIALVIPVLPGSDSIMKAKGKAGRFLVKQYIEHSLAEFGTDKQFDAVKEAMGEWMPGWAD